MCVCGQRHAPAALPPGMTRYPLYRRLGGPQGRSGRVLKTSPPTEIRFPDCPARITGFGPDEGSWFDSRRRHRFPVACVQLSSRIHAASYLIGTRDTISGVQQLFSEARRQRPSNTGINYTQPYVFWALCLSRGTCLKSSSSHIFKVTCLLRVPR
jgi:hypothetical protein